MAQVEAVSRLFAQRFGETPDVPAELNENAVLQGMARRGSCRAFSDTAPSLDTMRTICAAALCAPSKSDLQQRDILIVDDPAHINALKQLLSAQDWIAGAPRIMLFLANNRRQRLLHKIHQEPFANDHLDAFFNASLDAGIALAFCMAAAEAAGLGCCPISTIRNHLPQVAALFDLPDHVFPVAALAVGYPAHEKPKLSPRLALQATVHTNRFRETSAEDIREYDNRRLSAPATPPDAKPWSQAKAKMYAQQQRAGFADFAKSIGFDLS